MHDSEKVQLANCLSVGSASPRGTPFHLQTFNSFHISIHGPSEVNLTSANRLDKIENIEAFLLHSSVEIKTFCAFLGTTHAFRQLLGCQVYATCLLTCTEHFPCTKLWRNPKELISNKVTIYRRQQIPGHSL